MIDIADVKTLTLKPGQTLVVQTETLLPASIRERLRNGLQEVFPNNKVLVIGKDLQLMVVDDERTNQRA
jgi:hypothetical protein